MIINEAIKAYSKDLVVAMPTETVYGLAAPIDRLDLIEKVFALKERPSFDPLIVHVCDESMAKKYSSDWSLIASQLAKAFWPGPLTIIVKKNDLVDKRITSGLETVGLRCPNHPMALEFIKKMDTGIAAPSANTFTKTSPTSPLHVKKYFSEKDVFVMDGGECEVGIESTIIDVSGKDIQILRPGMISKVDIEKVLNQKISYGKEHLKKVPGSHNIHYRPDYSLVLVKDEFLDDLEGAFVIEVNEPATSFARRLYDVIHTPLESSYKVKVIDLSASLKNYPHDYWDGILNRLEKASDKVL